MAEGGGAEGRGSYYESTGVIRDVMQNRETALTNSMFSHVLTTKPRHDSHPSHAHNGTAEIFRGRRLTPRKGNARSQNYQAQPGTESLLGPSP